VSKRETKRYIRRLEAEFEGAGVKGRGLTRDISKKGLFIRTQKALAPGTQLIVRLHLSDGKISVVKGIVRRAIKIPIYASEIKNGMGIEIIEMDDLFAGLLKELETEENLNTTVQQRVEKETVSGGDVTVEEFMFITCPSCGVKNKVAASKLSQGPRCGRCRTSLMVN